MFNQRSQKNINASIQFQLDMMMASINAKSLIAKYIFDKDNQEIFSLLFKHVPPKLLLAELNERTISVDAFEKIKIAIAKKDEFPALFNLPPHKWLYFLIEEQIHIEDIQALIGSGDGYEGAVSGMLDVIKEIENPVLRAWAFHYLLNYHDSNEHEMNVFLNSLETKDSSFRASFIQLHRLLNNTMVFTKHDDGLSISTRYTTESLLRIQKPVPPRRERLTEGEYKIAEQKYKVLLTEQNRRVEAACRLIRECIEDEFNNIIYKLDTDQTIQLLQLQEKQDECLANQLLFEEFNEIDKAEEKYAARPLPPILFDIYDAMIIPEPQALAMQSNLPEAKSQTDAKHTGDAPPTANRRLSF